MGIYKIVRHPDGPLGFDVLSALPDAVRALRRDPMWSASRGQVAEALTRFREAALNDRRSSRAVSLAAVLEAQISAGLDDGIGETLSVAAAIPDLHVLRLCRLLAQAGLREEAFALALGQTGNLRSGIDAAMVLLELFPESAADIVDAIRDTCNEIALGQRDPARRGERMSGRRFERLTGNVET